MPRIELRLWLIRALLGTLLAAGLAPLQAAEVRWRTEKFAYVTKGQAVRDFLRQFGASQGLTVVVDPAVEGTVVGNFNLTPQSMLEFVATTFGLIWYYDGNVLYVYPTSEARSQILRLNYTTSERLKQTLTKLGINDKRYPITFDASANTALVSGPKRYVELVEQSARALDQNESSRGASDIQVFPLKYAWAADYTFTQGGREFKLPGVASVLRNLYNNNNNAQAPANAIASLRRGGSNSTVDKLRGLGLINPDAAGGEAQRLGSDAPSEAEAGGAQLGLPQFQPDGRLNAVVIRDLPERMAFYERVVRALDVRPGIVEIEARIIEVSSDAVESLGVDWRFQSNRVDVQTGRGNLPTLDFNNTLNGPLPPGAGNSSGSAGGIPGTGITPPTSSPDAARGGIFSLRLGDAGRFLLARVSALAQEGKANILSSPRVMTLDNVEAVLENVSTFFVRVAGNLDVDLFNISSGTSLRVTPLIVPEGDQTHIKLAIKIEDGSLTSQQVDSIPVVRRSSIGTQAFINNGDALLIGGYAQETDNNSEVGVPGLSKIPVFGRLFRFDEKRKQRVERLFLLTPRVMPMPGLPPLPPAQGATQ
jgi:type III secretion protein C